MLLKIIVHNNESIKGFFHIAKAEYTLKDVQAMHKDLKEYYKEIQELLDQMKTLTQTEFERILGNHNIEKNTVINRNKPYIRLHFKNVEFENIQTSIEENRSKFKELLDKYNNSEEDFKTDIFNKVKVHDEIIKDISSANDLIEEKIEKIAELLIEKEVIYEEELSVILS